LELDQHHSLLARELEDEYGNISPDLKAQFFLNDHLDTVVWAGASLLDLYFHVDLDKIPADHPANYSADKNIGEPKKAFRNSENPKLVHLVFDQDLPQNTLGTITVQNLKDANGQYIDTHRKTFLYDNRPIGVATLQVLNDGTIDLVFNKGINADFASIKNNYTINKGIGHPIIVDQFSPEAIKLVFEPLIEEETYTLSIAGLQDVFGIKMTRTIILDF